MNKKLFAMILTSSITCNILSPSEQQSSSLADAARHHQTSPSQNKHSLSLEPGSPSSDKDLKAAFDKCNAQDMDDTIAQFRKQDSDDFEFVFEIACQEVNSTMNSTHNSGPRVRKLPKLDAALTKQSIKDSPARVQELVKHFSVPENFNKDIWEKRFILYGPSGTGKTTMGRAMASSWNLPFLYYGSSDISNQFHASGNVNLRIVFEIAKRVSPCVLAIDELQDMVKSSKNSKDYDSSMLTQLWQNIDSYKQHPIFFVTMLNYVQKMPQQVLTRFEDYLEHIPLPDEKQRKDVMRFHLKQCQKKFKLNGDALLEDKKAFKQLIKITQGLSHRQLETLIRHANGKAIDRDENNPILKIEDCYEYLKKRENISLEEPKSLKTKVIRFLIKPYTIPAILALLGITLQFVLHKKQSSQASSMHAAQMAQAQSQHAAQMAQSQGQHAAQMAQSAAQHQAQTQQTATHHNAQMTQQEKHFKKNLEANASKSLIEGVGTAVGSGIVHGIIGLIFG